MSQNKKETLFKFYPIKRPVNEASFLSHNFPHSVDLLSDEETKPVSMRSYFITQSNTLAHQIEPESKSNIIGLQTKTRVHQARIENWAQLKESVINAAPVFKGTLKKRNIDDYYQRKNSGASDELFNKPLAVAVAKPKKNTIEYYYKAENVKKKSKLTSFPKFILIRIIQFLRIRQNVVLSSVSKQFNTVYRFLFIFSDHFANLNTENYDDEEIKFIIKKRKSAQLSILNQMLRGKSLKTFLSKNSISWEANNQSKNHSELLKFGVFPKKSKQINTLITDANFEEVYENGRLSLQDLRLVNSYLLTHKSFSLIARIKNLQILHITFSSALQDNVVRDIVTGCKYLIDINFSRCSELTSNSLMHILNTCCWLESLDLSYNAKMFSDKDYIDFFCKPVALKTLNIEGCGFSIRDILQIISLCKNLEVIVVDRRMVEDPELVECLKALSRPLLKVSNS